MISLLKDAFSRALMGAVSCVALTSVALPSPASAFFVIIPIPRLKIDPDKIDATSDQRKLAMCAAYHKGVVDTDIDGRRGDSWHGDVLNTVVERLSGYPDAKKLIGAYLGQWDRQQKQNFESGQAYGRIMIDACADANLPAHRRQYDYWKGLAPGASGEAASLSDIPPKPVKLDNLIFKGDFPAAIQSEQAPYTTTVTLQIDREGEVVDCFVEETSGSDEIDQATCDLLKARARFEPAIEDGYPVVSEYLHQQTWPDP